MFLVRMNSILNFLRASTKQIFTSYLFFMHVVEKTMFILLNYVWDLS